jgi:hypothetical protein
MLLRSRYAFVLRSGPDRPRPYGVAASVALHAAIVLLLLIPLLKRDFARVLTAGESLTTRSGGGGGRVAYITLPTPKAPARATVNVTPPLATPPAIVVPTPTPPPEIPPPTPEAQVAVAAVAVDSSRGGTGGPVSGGEPGEGGGTGGGVGEGAGPGAGPGSGERGAGRAPQIRHQVIPPENPPKELRGVELRITFMVDESGRPVRVEVDPPIQDKKFARKLTESMLSYRFRPALGPDGRPVASTYTQLVSW